MWEYKFVGINDKTNSMEFNEYGKDRWELVTIYQSGSVQKMDDESYVYVTDNNVAVFKRAKRN